MGADVQGRSQPRAVLFGPDDKHGAKPRAKFRRYVWYVVWREGGVRREQSLGVEYGTSPEAALADWLLARAATPATTGPMTADMMTVADALARYAAEHAAGVAAPARIGFAIDALVRHLGASPLSAMTGNARRKYARDRGVSDSTIRRELGVLDAAARHCVREGHLAAYPDDQWLPASPPPRERWLTVQEVARLVRAARNGRARHYLPLFILLAIYTGRRRDAILSLEWTPSMTGGHVDLERGIIDFRPLGRSETKKRRGQIPIPARLIGLLRGARRRTVRYVIEDAGQPVGSIKKSLASAGRRAGIEGVHPHLLKHTAVTWLARRGVSMEDVSLYTDTTVETLRRVYRQHDPAMHAAVLAALSGRRSR